MPEWHGPHGPVKFLTAAPTGSVDKRLHFIIFIFCRQNKFKQRVQTMKCADRACPNPHHFVHAETTKCADRACPNPRHFAMTRCRRSDCICSYQNVVGWAATPAMTHHSCRRATAGNQWTRCRCDRRLADGQGRPREASAVISVAAHLLEGMSCTRRSTIPVHRPWPSRH